MPVVAVWRAQRSTHMGAARLALHPAHAGATRLSPASNQPCWFTVRAQVLQISMGTGFKWPVGSVAHGGQHTTRAQLASPFYIARDGATRALFSLKYIRPVLRRSPWCCQSRMAAQSSRACRTRSARARSRQLLAACKRGRGRRTRSTDRHAPGHIRRPKRSPSEVGQQAAEQGSSDELMHARRWRRCWRRASLGRLRGTLFPDRAARQPPAQGRLGGGHFSSSSSESMPPTPVRLQALGLWGCYFNPRPYPNV